MTRKRVVAIVLIAGCLILSCGVTYSFLDLVRQDWYGPEIEGPIEKPFSYSGIVSISTPDGAGSGFVVRREDDGYLVVTAAHVVDVETMVLVNGIESDVLLVDYETDVAIVFVPESGQNWYVLPLLDAEIEEKCRVVGFVYVNSFDNPLFVVYWGRVTSVNWTGRISFSGGAFPGVSGGPLINEDGKVLGICSQFEGAWGLPMETAVLFSPSENIEALLEMIDDIVATTQPSGD